MFEKYTINNHKTYYKRYDSNDHIINIVENLEQF